MTYMHILVTGASGFVGGNLCLRCVMLGTTWSRSSAIGTVKQGDLLEYGRFEQAQAERDT